jgi:hypothetical protein
MAMAAAAVVATMTAHLAAVTHLSATMSAPAWFRRIVQ